MDGGYTQKDVTEVARCFTGWTIDQPQRGGTFRFAPRLHDHGEKIVLGVKIPAGGGKKDGEKVLDIVAHHPSTAHFISTQAGAAIRGRRSAGLAGGPHGADLPQDRRRPARGDADHARVEGILVGGRLPLEDEIAARSGGERGARDQRQRGFRHRAGESGGATRRAAVPQAGADRVFQFQPRLDEHRGPDGAHEFRPATFRQQGAGRDGGQGRRRRARTPRWGRRSFRSVRARGKAMINRRVFLRNSALAMVGAGTAPLWLQRALYADGRSHAAQEDSGGHFPARRGRRA